MADVLSERIKLCPELRHSMHFVRQMKEKEHRTIAMYLIVRALDPGIPRTQRDMSKAIRSLMTALDAYTAREPRDIGMVEREEFKSYSILYVYRQRVVNTVAAVILGVENSVATRNMDRQHYSVNAHQIAILYPLVNEYCNYNLIYKLKAYPTLWGSNAQAMKPGSWTAYNKDLNTGAPFLYVVCIHLYYIIFDGGSYGKPMRRAADMVPIHPFSQFIYGAKNINTFWMDNYCNVDGNVSKHIQMPYKRSNLMHDAHILEMRYQQFMTLHESMLDDYSLAYASDTLHRPRGKTVPLSIFEGTNKNDTPINQSSLDVLGTVIAMADIEAIQCVLQYTVEDYNDKKAGDLLECIVNRMMNHITLVPEQENAQRIGFRPLGR